HSTRWNACSRKMCRTRPSTIPTRASSSIRRCMAGTPTRCTSSHGAISGSNQRGRPPACWRCVPREQARCLRLKEPPPSSPLAPAASLALIARMLNRLLLAILSCLLVAGCAKKEVVQGSGGPGTRKVLRFGNGSEPQDLDPHVVTGTVEYRLLQ